MKNKHLFLAILAFYMSCQSSIEKMPITSSSKQAIQLYQQAFELEGRLEIDAAEKTLKQALVLDSTFVAAHIRLAMLRDNFDVRKKHLKLAMRHIDKVSEGEQLLLLARNKFYGTQEGKEEFDCFQELVRLYPEDEEANYLFGFVHLHHGKSEPDTAIAYFKKAIELNPSISHYYNELAYAYMTKRDFGNAEKTIKDYIIFLPNHENPRDTYAEMLMRTHRYEESLNAYKKVLEINPQAPWAYMGSAANLSFLGRYHDARKTLDKLDQLPLSDYEYRHKWRARICSYIMEGKIDSAIVVLEQQNRTSASGDNQREPIFHQYYAQLRATNLHFAAEQTEQGLASYQRWKKFVQDSLTNEKSIAHVLALEDYYSAYAHVLEQEYSKAQIILDQMTPLSEDMQLLQARIYIEEDRTKDAINLLEQLDASNPYYLSWLVIAYHKNEQVQKVQATKDQIKSLIEMNNIDYALAIGNE